MHPISAILPLLLLKINIKDAEPQTYTGKLLTSETLLITISSTFYFCPTLQLIRLRPTPKLLVQLKQKAKQNPHRLVFGSSTPNQHNVFVEKLLH